MKPDRSRVNKTGHLDLLPTARSAQLVKQNMGAIEVLAAALLAKEYEPLKPFRSGSVWSKANTAKYVTGEEVVGILEQHGIAASCGSLGDFRYRLHARLK